MYDWSAYKVSPLATDYKTKHNLICALLSFVVVDISSGAIADVDFSPYVIEGLNTSYVMQHNRLCDKLSSVIRDYDGAGGLVDFSPYKLEFPATDYASVQDDFCDALDTYVNYGNLVKDGVLSSLVTFTRAGSATYFDSTGTLQTAAADVARVDYDPVTLELKGAPFEEQRTNSIRNNTMVGAVAGTPGTLPTNWASFTVLTGITRDILGAGTEDGINYIDIRLSGTPSGIGNYQLFFEQNSTIAAVTAQSWARSVFVKLVSGSLTGIELRQGLNENTAAAAFIKANNSSAFAPTSGNLRGQRFDNTVVLSGGATTAYLTPYLYIGMTGVAIDITLRIGLPQLELGAFVTSPILTTTAAATRLVDSATGTGANFSSWYRQDEGAFFVDYRYGQKLAAIRLLAVSDGTVNNFMEIIAASGSVPAATAGAYLFGAESGGGALNTSVGSTLPNTANTSRKVAAGYKTDDCASSTNGGPIGTDTGFALPAVNTMYLANAVGASSTLINGHIKRVCYFRKRLPDAALQSLAA